MRRTTMLFGLTAVLTIGCHGHEAKVADLQKQYDELARKYHQDCSAEMLNLPQKVSEKCSAEDKQVTEAWNRLQAERANK